jgi:hypothetical protein
LNQPQYLNPDKKQFLVRFKLDMLSTKNKTELDHELTRQYVSTSINSALIIVVISKQPSVMSLLNYHKSNWRLVIGLQGCTGLYP